MTVEIVEAPLAPNDWNENLQNAVRAAVKEAVVNGAESRDDVINFVTENLTTMIEVKIELDGDVQRFNIVMKTTAV